MAEKKFYVTKDALQAKYEELGSAAAAAEFYGVSKKLVLNYIKRFGIQLRPRRAITSAVGDRIRSMAAEQRGSQEIAAAIGFSTTAVRKYAKSAGFPIVDRCHKGHTITDSGYRKLWAPDHPRSDAKGYAMEHVLVMEAHIGRYLHKDETVHHKDYDKLNNSLSNLELMLDVEHRRFHANAGDCGWVKYHAT